MNNFEGILTALASVVVILTGLITTVAKISGAHPLRWIRTHTIDRFKAWVEVPRREIEQLQLGLAALQQEQRAMVDRVEEQLLAQQNETAELKAALTHQTERVNSTTVRFDQSAGKLSELESSLETFRQWIEQVLPPSNQEK